MKKVMQIALPAAVILLCAAGCSGNKTIYFRKSGSLIEVTAPADANFEIHVQ